MHARSHVRTYARGARNQVAAGGIRARDTKTESGRGRERERERERERKKETVRLSREETFAPRRT